MVKRTQRKMLFGLTDLDLAILATLRTSQAATYAHQIAYAMGDDSNAACRRIGRRLSRLRTVDLVARLGHGAHSCWSAPKRRGPAGQDRFGVHTDDFPIRWRWFADLGTATAFRDSDASISRRSS